MVASRGSNFVIFKIDFFSQKRALGKGKTKKGTKKTEIRIKELGDNDDAAFTMKLFLLLLFRCVLASL